MKIFWPILILLFGLPVWSWGAEITVHVDRNPVNLNESFQLTFSAAEEPDGQPDFSPLDRDFSILNQSHSSQSSWVNGKVSQSVSWVLDVMAKQSGTLTVPAISFGNDLSQPLSLQVLAATQNRTTARDDDLFLEVKVNPESVYVQSQLLYTVKLYRRVQMTDARLSEPELDGAVIEKLGDTKNYHQTIQGVDYAVSEISYAIFPQHSGIVTIQPVTLVAEIVQNSQPRFNGFFNRAFTKTRRVLSEAMTLNVKPASADFPGSYWIPAQQLYLEETWPSDAEELKVGEPVTRTLSLLGKGTTVAQLPELFRAELPEGLKAYPDQPLLKEQPQDDGLLALREEKIAFIPSQPGRFVLPAIEIPWFNTQTEQIEFARLPERVIQVSGAVKKPVVDNMPTVNAPSVAEKMGGAESVGQTETDHFWMWISLLLASGWLTQMGFGFYRQRKQGQVSSQQPASEAPIKLNQALEKAKHACRQNNPQQSKEALLIWAHGLGLNSLSALARSCPEDLSLAIMELNQVLYTDKHTGWQGERLLQALKKYRPSHEVSPQEKPELEPLFKL